MTAAVILGNPFQATSLESQQLLPVDLPDKLQHLVLYRYADKDDAYVLLRHGASAQYLPPQIVYRDEIAALTMLGCDRLLITGSVGVLDSNIPLFMPLLVSDLLMPENRLPDGSACTMFLQQQPEQGYLILQEGLFSKKLSEQLMQAGKQLQLPIYASCVLAYCQGPRLKTPAENRFWQLVGAQVNSMTVGPEVILANEMQIATTCLVTGHKISINVFDENRYASVIDDSLQRTGAVIWRFAEWFLHSSVAVPFANSIYMSSHT